MFKMKNNKWDDWYDSLPAHTKAYLNNQPLWHDRDMWKAGIIGCAVGIVLGIMLRG